MDVERFGSARVCQTSRCWELHTRIPADLAPDRTEPDSTPICCHEAPSGSLAGFGLTVIRMAVNTPRGQPAGGRRRRSRGRRSSTRKRRELLLRYGTPLNATVRSPTLLL